ncbi:PT domain-containing protein [Microbispora bryophytorum]|uniref:PT domain-containing protein n=1 Tax=Microbispora bryophytorum subsp. camponoti TaxID=1677852 RepID=A0ABR8L6G7_9ACTN|nr:PT domain-containing protein [Microbispora camponoti]MBD3146512.1 PT domain-containing protein [Microbispora camponoti]
MRYLSIATAAAVLAVTVTGCGGGDDTAATTTTTTTTQAAAGGGSSAGSQAAFTECLRKNGVTLPSGQPWGRPGGRPSGRPTDRPTARPTARPSGGFGGFRSMDPAMSKAFEACRSLMPQGGRGGFGGRRGADPQAMQAFRTCMKDNGAELPADGRVRRDPATADPKAAKAYDKCKVLLPAPNPAPTPAA